MNSTTTQWDKDHCYFYLNEEKIRKKYGSGIYVAISNERVIDSDKDRYKLIERLREKPNVCAPIRFTGIDARLN